MVIVILTSVRVLLEMRLLDHCLSDMDSPVAFVETRAWSHIEAERKSTDVTIVPLVSIILRATC